jgi:hypothetical protein
VGNKIKISTCQFFKFDTTDNDTQHNCLAPNITVLDHDINHPLALLKAITNQPYKLLGVHIAFDGYSLEQSQALIQKFAKFAHTFSQCLLTPEDTLQGYRSIFLPEVSYGLAATIDNTTKLRTDLV